MAGAGPVGQWAVDVPLRSSCLPVHASVHAPRPFVHRAPARVTPRCISSVKSPDYTRYIVGNLGRVIHPFNGAEAFVFTDLPALCRLLDLLLTLPSASGLRDQIATAIAQHLHLPLLRHRLFDQGASRLVDEDRREKSRGAAVATR